MTAYLLLAILLLAVASFASVGARSLRRLSRSKLDELYQAEPTRPLYDQIIALRERTTSGADSLQVVAAAAAVGFACAWARGVSLNSEPEWLGPAIIIVIGLTLLWLSLVWAPSSIARLWADPFVLNTWSLWIWVARILAPSVWAAYGIARLLERVSGRKPAQPTEESLEEEILTIVSEGQREGLLEEPAREMIESVIELSDVDVAEIMTPRTDVVSLHVESGWDDAVRFVSQSGHSRVPVFNKSPDDIVGVLHAKDILAEIAKADESTRQPLAKILRKPFFVPESKRVDQLLGEFQRSRNHLAIVLDEFGGVSGIVTIEDALEEIVGEIADEYDDVAAADGIKTIDEHRVESQARVRIHEINERLGLSLPEDEDFDTIGGFVFHELGRIPNVGEELIWQDVRIVVLEATRRRIGRVAVEVLRERMKAEG